MPLSLKEGTYRLCYRRGVLPTEFLELIKGTYGNKFGKEELNAMRCGYETFCNYMNSREGSHNLPPSLRELINARKKALEEREAKEFAKRLPVPPEDVPEKEKKLERPLKRRTDG